jgi:intracellular septation protein A
MRVQGVLEIVMEKINISKNILISGLVLLLAGFIIMAAGNDTYSFVKITLAPLLILSAFGLVAYSVMHKKPGSDV